MAPADVPLECNALLAFDNFVFDPVGRRLRKDGVALKIDSKQLELLEAFLRAPQTVLTHEVLLDRVWQHRFVAESALSVAVAKLRKALGRTPAGGDYIENRYGQGYRFCAAVVTLRNEVVSSAMTDAVTPTPARWSVGRRENRERLNAAIEGAKNGRGSFFALIGEPGIGKTHLAEMVEQDAQARNVRSAWGRLHAASGLPPLWPFMQMLVELDQAQDADKISKVWNDAEVCADTHAPSAAVRFTLGAIRTSVETSREIVHAIHRTSREQPLLLLLDDLQWADAATLHTLSYLIGDISRWPIVIIAMARGSELDSSQTEVRSVLSHRNCERVELARLNQFEIDEYLNRTFGETNAALSSEVFTRSEGNAFFMVELLRPWIGAGLPKPAQLRLSKLALEIMRQRLHSLPEGALRVLSIAAVVGRDFDLGLVSQVDGRASGDVLDDIDASLANGTVVESVQVPGAYAFDHELIREVLYDNLPAPACCRLHLRVGEVLERRRAAGVAVTSAQLAHHFLSALPHGDVNHAIAHARAAAAAARRFASHSEVRSLLERALEATKLQEHPDPEVLTTLLLELAMVERVLGEVRYLEHLERAVALARQRKLGQQLAIAGRLLSPTPGLPGPVEGYRVLMDALALLPPDAKAARACVLVHLAWTPPNCSSDSCVNQLLSEAEALIADTQDPDPAELLWEAKLFFNSAPDRREYAEALAADIDRELRANPELAQQGRILSTWMYRMVSASQCGDKHAMQSCIDERTAFLSKLNNTELQWHQERVPLIMRMNRGDFNGLEREFNRLEARARRLQLQGWRDVWGRDFGTLLVWTAELSDFAARARVSLALAPNEIPMIRARKILALTEYGFMDDARAALDEISSAWLRDLPHDREYIVVLAELAYAAAMAAHHEHCAELYELLMPYEQYYAASVSYHNEGSINHMLGLVARVLGRDLEACAHFELAIERNQRFELFACAIRSQFELAKLLTESQLVASPTVGRELLEKTHAEALARGMYPLAKAARMRFERGDTEHRAVP